MKEIGLKYKVDFKELKEIEELIWNWEGCSPYIDKENVNHLATQILSRKDKVK